MPQQDPQFGGFGAPPGPNKGSLPEFGGASSPFGNGGGFAPQPQPPVQRPQFEEPPSGPFGPGGPSGAGPAAPALPIRSTSAPLQALIPSMVMALVSLVLSATITFGDFTPTEFFFRVFSVTAWAAAGVFGVTMLGLFFNADNRKRAEGFYSVLGWKSAVYWATVGGLLLGIVWSAIEIGQWVGKL